MQNPLGASPKSGEGAGPENPGEGGGGGDDPDKISKNKVSTTLKKLHEEVNELVQDKKFRKNFMLNYK